MIVDATKKGPKRLREFEMAEEVGALEPLKDALNALIKDYKGHLPKDGFPTETLFYMINEGIKAAKVPPNFKVRTLTVLARAFLHGYIIGKKIVGD